jgi:uncharacterized protein YdaU (DUF1376 family)
MHYYQHHIGDFIKDTSYLTNEETAIYLKLLWLYYDTEQPLPNNIFTLSVKTNCRNNETALKGILEMFFLLKDDSFWHHTRCDTEIAHYHSMLNSASKAGKASAAKRAANKTSTNMQQLFNNRLTDVQLTNNHKPITNNHIKTIPIPEGMNVVVWADYLALRNKQKKPLTETALKGLQREADKAKKPLVDVLQICCERGWIGFKSEWVEESGQSVKPNNQSWRTNDGLMMAKALELGLTTVGLQRYDIINKIDATLRSRGL